MSMSGAQRQQGYDAGTLGNYADWTPPSDGPPAPAAPSYSSPFVSSTAPGAPQASAASPSDWATQAAAALGVTAPSGMNSVEQQFYYDELSGALAIQEQGGQSPYGGSYTSGLSGFSFPPSISPDDLQRVLSQAETFAAAAGWRFFPQAQQLIGMIGQGPLTQQQFFSQMWGRMHQSDQQAMPWLQYGMTNQQYQDTNNSYNDVMLALTGTTGDASNPLFSQALSNNWSPARLQEMLMNDPTTQKQYGWIKYGMNYNQFQQYLVQNKPQLEQRYGVGQSNAQTGLANLAAPLTSFGAYAPAVSIQSQGNPLAQQSTSAVR